MPLGLRPWLLGRSTVCRKTSLYKYLIYYFNIIVLIYFFERHLATLIIAYNYVTIVSADQLWCARYFLISVLIYNSAYNLLDKLTSVC